jgi:hypothetical protein
MYNETVSKYWKRKALNVVCILGRRPENARDEDRHQLRGGGPRSGSLSLRLRGDQAKDRREKVRDSVGSKVLDWIDTTYLTHSILK